MKFSGKETTYIRCDSELMEEIKKGLTALRRNKAKLYSLDDLFKTETKETVKDVNLKKSPMA